MNTFAEKVWDYVPHEECIVLPYRSLRVFMEFNQEMERRGEASCLYSYACRIFAEEIQISDWFDPKELSSAAKFALLTKHA